jgi:hypothetical protein
MDKQWAAFFEKHGDPNSPFARVNPHTALVLVEKYVICVEIIIRKNSI